MSIKVYDDIFDIHWINQLSFDLIHSTWDIDNIAGRKGWPYKTQGRHRLMGQTFFNKNGMGSNVNIANNLLRAFHEHIKHYVQRPSLDLDHITGNCQFKYMDGAFHNDGSDTDQSFVLMLYYPECKVTGGEFIYKPTNKKISFKQGRLIHFTASHPHRANAFNEKDIPRFSIKWLAHG